MVVMPLIEKGLLRSPECVMLPLLRFLQCTTIELSNFTRPFLKSILQNIRSSNEMMGKQSCECLSCFFRKLNGTEPLVFVMSEVFELYNGKTTLIEHKYRIIGTILDSIPQLARFPEVCNLVAQNLTKIVAKESNEMVLQSVSISLAQLIDLTQVSETSHILEYFKISLKNDKQSANRRASLIAFPHLCRTASVATISFGLSIMLDLFGRWILMSTFEPDLIHVCNGLLALQRRDITAGMV
jgi:hypothetical protein